MGSGEQRAAGHVADRLSVTVACSLRAGSAEELGVELPPGSTVVDALRRSGVLQRHPEIDLAHQPVGVWGRPCALDQPLRHGDRVELYRPLRVDPKEARRLRQRRQQGERDVTRGT